MVDVLAQGVTVGAVGMGTSPTELHRHPVGRSGRDAAGGPRCAPPQIVNDLPARGRRPLERAYRYRCIVKAGEPAFIDGEHTGQLSGRQRWRRPAPPA